MAVTRRNILADAGAMQRFVEGVTLLKREFTGPQTTDFGIPGPPARVSTYDLFVVWHHVAMMTFTPPTQQDRNAAHRGPVFFPWHRFMLLLFERHLQRALHDRNVALPYWDWAADGELPAAQQAAAPLWAATGLGGAGTPVATGPFAFNAADPQGWRVRVAANANGQLVQLDRGLRRAFGQTSPTLPRKQQVRAALGQATYDAAPWNTASAGFRNRAEGWRPAASAPNLHNRVHTWVGGDMLPSSSPNDPVFYLNHCNEDRIWAAWLQRHGATYAPLANADPALAGHRLNDPMHALLSPPMTPGQVLDVRSIYTYDSLAVA